MKLGLIGHPLKHSWSPEIHYYLIGEDYALFDLAEEELDGFFARKEFDGINVTIPYKKTVLKYTDELGPTAEKVGAVNCIVKNGDRLIGHNTDLAGLITMIRSHGFALEGKQTAILGTGGSSLAAYHAVKELGGIPVRVSRNPGDAEISYRELYEKAASFAFLINATPVGMYPATEAVPCDLTAFPSLEGVIDVVANPMRTHLVQCAQEMGIPACGGLEMLVAQAYEADRLFTGSVPGISRMRDCYRNLQKARRNIVLIGMPGSGKTSLGKAYAEETGRPVVDLDEEITAEIGMPIEEFFAKYGEEAFREKETEAVRRYKDFRGIVLITGGGIVKKEINMRLLKENGLAVYIQRDLSLLETGNGRPLSKTKEAVEKLYAERKHLYEKYRDVTVRNEGNPEDAVRELAAAAGDTL